MEASEENLISEGVVEFTDTTLDEAIHAADTPVLVHFRAPWCGACKMVAQIMREVAAEYAEKVLVGSLNTKLHRDSAIEFAISKLPTIILFNEGQIRARWVGLTGKGDIRSAIERLLK